MCDRDPDIYFACPKESDWREELALRGITRLAGVKALWVEQVKGRQVVAVWLASAVLERIPATTAGTPTKH